MAKKSRKLPSRVEKRRATASAAMPEVKKLVRRFGRLAVHNCLVKIHEQEKALAHLADLKREVAKLSQAVR